MVALARSNLMPVSEESEVSAFQHDVLKGLGARRKQLPPKYFYDGTGSQLFERITDQPEYYPTRCEIHILQDNAAAIACCSLGGGIAT